MSKFLAKIRAINSILFKKKNHWALIEIDTPNLIKLFEGEGFDVTYHYNGMKPYIFFKMIKNLANSKNDIEMMLDKAQFEADAMEWGKKK